MSAATQASFLVLAASVLLLNVRINWLREDVERAKREIERLGDRR